MNEVTKAGKMQDIGGIRLYYEFFERQNENITVVFESGYGFPSDYWKPIKDEISKFAQFLIYDRAGLGESEKDDRPKDSKQSVENLRNLLQNANIKPPYMFVGHSIGGANVRLYASTYPEEVAAVILLDSCHEDQNKIMPPLFTEEMRSIYFDQFSVEGSLNEIQDSLEQISKANSLGDIPLTVVSAGLQSYHTTESFAAWNLFQRDLTHLSTKRKHIIVEDAGHLLHIDQPQVIIDIIKDTLKEIKKGSVAKISKLR
ncbi:alpha/beta fold hydrolase [Bacillus bingmayongensis]|uniref:alpha/beta fold hydrolase n=1 Tax=Bacillus bingmayongensis TaxID=1150157 RepID=UPI0002DC7F57|nr:alpha/beta hydrolase [Bacillus bingmayongensis]MBY0598063.1 alpha/beta hydrolase [Bacillus bingmayongensis]